VYDSASDAVGTTASTEDTASKVEVVTDTSPAPSPEISAAHAARRAGRQAAREARSEERWDFLSSLNLDLLTAEQRARHALYLEAIEAYDAARKEIAALRADGKDVPAALQSRLTDAQSVLRADHDAELRALKEAAARARGLDEASVRLMLEDLAAIERALVR